MLRILDKPAGLTTHTSLSKEERVRIDRDPIDSFLGHLTARSEIPLWPVHRLDLGTTGVLLAADNVEEAAELSIAFEARDVEKTYYFLTDREPTEPTDGIIHIESYIDRQNGGRGSNFFSREGSTEHPNNAKTEFEFVSRHAEISLWRARPFTGRPHQIRLHAESLGIPILGDGEHGGSSFPAICLHAAHIRLLFKGETVEATSPSPRWFTDPTLLTSPSDLRLVNWIAAVERRERLHRSLTRLGVAESETMRLIHTEGMDLRADRLGHIVQFHWYAENFDLVDRKAIEDLARVMGWRDWFIQARINRGKNPNDSEMILSYPELPLRWQAKEDSLNFSFRRDTGLSTGLFLDQRANRRWTLENAKDARVLNLFSYTSGFSLAAAVAGAAKVVSVDLSKNFLLWSKENFALNKLDPEDERFEFRAMEAREFLKWAKKKERQFDFVICDPPSFARSEAGVFRIERELEALLERCVEVTAPGGILLFSTNYELFDNEEFYHRLQEFAQQSKRELKIVRTPSPDLDFEFPRETRIMKSAFLEIS
jgi:23S rRNA (cytosine1962-C5)-methyltransferase